MKKSGLRRLALSVCIASALSTLSASVFAAPPSHAKALGTGNPVAIDDLPPGLFKNQLKALPAQAQARAQGWLNSIHFHEQDLRFMRVDKEGGIFFADTYLPDFSADPSTTGDTSTVLPADGSIDPFRLHSKPGATRVVYLDFDGHTISGTAWNSYTGTPVLEALPYDQDGNPAAFSDAEKANIVEIWRRVAEDYAPFDIDVTTEEPVSFGPTVGRLLMTEDVDANGRDMPAKGAGGVAYVNVWGLSNYASYYSPALVYAGNLGGGRPDYVTEAASHELGHNLGLSHDATSTASYYGGHGTGFTSWGPIMGTGYNRQVSQWSQGEYADANQFEDDIGIIAAKLAYQSDDHGDRTDSATPLLVDAAGQVSATTRTDDPANLAAANKGIIGSRNDVDVFSFSTTGGSVSLQVTPDWEARYTRGTNLDVLMAVYDQFGTLVAQNNPAEETSASLNLTLTAGTYYLTVTGTGSANYPDYGSLGYYRISGTLPQSNDTQPPQPNPMGWATVPAAVDEQAITMTASTATDDTSSVEYYFACANCQDSGWQPAATYTVTGLTPETTYSFTVKARDAFGNETAASVAAAATTSAAPEVNEPPVANADSANVALQGSVTVPVLANDTDPDGDVLTITSVTDGAKGSVVISGDEVVYTAGRKRGGDTFTYTVSDGNGHSATASVTIAIVRSTDDGGTDGGGNGGKGGKGKKK